MAWGKKSRTTDIVLWQFGLWGVINEYLSRELVALGCPFVTGGHLFDLRKRFNRLARTRTRSNYESRDSTIALGCISVVVLHHSTEMFPALNRAFTIPNFLARNDEPVAQSLMIPFNVVVLKVSNSCPSRRWPTHPESGRSPNLGSPWPSVELPNRVARVGARSTWENQKDEVVKRFSTFK
jgi:hypothetical protein